MHYISKPRELLETHERAGADFLALNGFDAEILPEDPNASVNLDLLMNGEMWEMKNLSNSTSSVSNQVKRARLKWFKLGIDAQTRGIFTCEGNTDGFNETCAAHEARRRPGEVFMVTSAKGVVRILRDK